MVAAAPRRLQPLSYLCPSSAASRHGGDGLPEPRSCLAQRWDVSGSVRSDERRVPGGERSTGRGAAGREGPSCGIPTVTGSSLPSPSPAHCLPCAPGTHPAEPCGTSQSSPAPAGATGRRSHGDSGSVTITVLMQGAGWEGTPQTPTGAGGQGGLSPTAASVGCRRCQPGKAGLCQAARTRAGPSGVAGKMAWPPPLRPGPDPAARSPSARAPGWLTCGC